MKIKTTIFIYREKYAWDNEEKFVVYSFQFNDDENRQFVCSQEVEIEIPNDYDPRAQQIVALEAKKQKAMADYQKTVTDINNRINNLKAITV